MTTALVERRLTVAEVAEAVGLSVHAVLRLIDSGELRAADYSRRGAKRPTWRIHPDDVRAFEAKRSSTLGKESTPNRKPTMRGFKRYV